MVVTWTALSDAIAAPTALLDEWYDLTGDGIITNDDLVELQGLVGSTTTPGDFDGDGDVDGSDFLEWQRTDGTAGGLTDWRDNYGNGFGALSAASAAVPEPNTTVLCLAAGLLSLVRRKK